LDLVELETHPDDSELLNEIFRFFHTIKGTSGFLGLVKLQKVTHFCEDLLNKLRKGEISLDEDIMDAILLAYDTIKELVGIISDEKAENFSIGKTLQKLENVFSSFALGDIEPDLQANPEEGGNEHKIDTNVKKVETKKQKSKKAQHPPQNLFFIIRSSCCIHYYQNICIICQIINSLSYSF